MMFQLQILDPDQRGLDPGILSRIRQDPEEGLSLLLCPGENLIKLFVAVIYEFSQ